MVHLIPFRTELRDGTPVLIRSVRPEDAPLLERGFAALSARSRTLRFLSAAPRLSPDDVRFLTRPDSPVHEAVGALDLSGNPPVACGIAHAIRLPGDGPPQAELAVTVADAWQGRGLGTILFAAVARLAQAGGTRNMVALVNRANPAMLRLLADLGARVARGDGAEQVLVLPLHADPAGWPSTAAGDAFRRIHRLAQVRD